MVRGRTPDLCWRLMDAQHWSSPRLARRQRVFVVADFGGQCSHEILFKPRAVQSISASGGDCWLSAACGDRGSFIEAGRRVPITRPFQCYRMRASAKERTTEAFRNSFGLPTDPFPTLLASAVSPFAFWYEDDPAGGCVRFPTERECERLMGLPEGWTKCGADGEEMTTINLKDFYAWYTHDEYIEVSDEVAAELKADKLYEEAHQRRTTRNKAQYSLDCDDGIEYSACLHEPTPQELLDRMELFIHLWNALNSLPEVQGIRVEAHLILGKSYRQIAQEQDVDKSVARRSVKRGIAAMKKYLKKVL